MSADLGDAAAFEGWRGDGPLLLPIAWARPVHDVQIVFSHSSYRGWTAQLFGDGFVVLDFAWHDHVDVLLATEETLPPGHRLPTLSPDELWWDGDQCWEATIRRLGDDLLIAETDATYDDQEHAEPELLEPGRVRVGRAYVSWHRLDAKAYDAAWESARRRLAAISQEADRGLRP